MTDHTAVTIAIREEMAVAAPDLPDTFADDADLRADLGIDSLAILELVARLELRFGIAVPDEDWPQLSSVDAIADYLAAQEVPA